MDTHSMAEGAPAAGVDAAAAAVAVGSDAADNAGGSDTITWRGLAYLDFALRTLDSTCDAEEGGSNQSDGDGALAKSAAKLRRALDRACEVAIANVNRSSVAAAGAVTSHLLELLAAADTRHLDSTSARKHVLVHDDVDAAPLLAYLKKGGHKAGGAGGGGGDSDEEGGGDGAAVGEAVVVERWRRFAGSDRGEGKGKVSARAWPKVKGKTAKTKGSGNDKAKAKDKAKAESVVKLDTAFIRVPVGRESLEMAAAAIAPHLAPNATVWVYGQTAANPTVANPNMLSQYGFSELTLATKHVGGVSSCVTRASWRGVPRELEKEKGLAAWGHDATLSVIGGGGGSLAWRTYPGLFAGGQLDIMTHFLLHTVPIPTPTLDGEGEGPVHVLDFACGSGSIGATINARAQSGSHLSGSHLSGTHSHLKVHLLDADAVSMEAAKLNVRG